MIYFLIGEDTAKKDEEIARIKKTILTSDEALQFDYEVLHAHKLDPHTLRKSLIALPALAKERLVILRDGRKLTAPNQKVLSDFILTKPTYVTLIVDFDELDLSGAFAQTVKSHIKVFTTASAPKTSVFDLTKAIERHKDAEALRILSNVLSEGAFPLQIMGALVWFWGKSKDVLSKEKFERGLNALQEADLSIKRSRLRPEQALELLVVKLANN